MALQRKEKLKAQHFERAAEALRSDAQALHKGNQELLRDMRREREDVKGIVSTKSI